MVAIKYSGISKFISDTPNEKELSKFTINELFIIARRHHIGLKQILINFILTKEKLQ